MLVRIRTEVAFFLQNTDQETGCHYFFPPDLRPEFEDVNMKNRIATAKLAWQPRAYDPHLHKWLHRIDVPTLIVWGANDRVFPMEHASVSKPIPQAFRRRLTRSVVVQPKHAGGHWSTILGPHACGMYRGNERGLGLAS